MRIAVLGAGQVGSAITHDLAAGDDLDITVADRDDSALERFADVPRVATVQADLADPGAVQKVIVGHDLAVGAVPGAIGFATLQAVLEAGVNAVDISFFPEDPFLLDSLARQRGVTAVVDCGIAPGCTNLIAGFLGTTFQRFDRLVCYAGGLPVERRWPWEYKAPFSPADVIEEYTRPARYVDRGVQVSTPALANWELIDFPGVGTLEAFATDGLRTLLRSMQVPFMEEKTLRYPGHIEKILALRTAGFFSEEPVKVGAVTVRPRDLTSRLLFKAWELRPDEEDITIVRVVAEGTEEGRSVRRTYELLDRYDVASMTSSMARTTGYTCTAAVRLLLHGLWPEAGIAPPEFLGRDRDCYDFIFAELAKRGVVFREKVETLHPSAG